MQNETDAGDYTNDVHSVFHKSRHPLSSTIFVYIGKSNIFEFFGC